MDASCTLSRDPTGVVIEIENALKPTRSDFLYVGNMEITRIKERTARGVDYRGVPFAPYSNKGPIYWYPSAHTKDPRASRNRFLKKIGGVEAGAAKTSTGVKFASYAALKMAVTGSGDVTLMGLKAPHMMMQIIVKVNGQTLTIGIYGEAADRAEGHNNGIPGRLPKREFFNASEDDKDQMTSYLVEAGAARANKA